MASNCRERDEVHRLKVEGGPRNAVHAKEGSIPSNLVEKPSGGGSCVDQLAVASGRDQGW
jgi:hypothetical protein